MSTSATSFRYPYQHPDPKTDDGFRLAFNALKDHADAFAALKAQIDKIQTTAQTVNQTITNTTTTVTGTELPVNVQNQAADYTLQQTDFGGINYFTGAGPYTVTLNTAITTPFFASVLNLSSGNVTLSPGATTINNLASVVLSPNQWAIVFWDGLLWWGLVGGSGTVTSVDATVPTEFTVSGVPITFSGTIAIAKANQNANLIWAGPSSGSAAAPAFRAMVTGDLPANVYYTPLDPVPASPNAMDDEFDGSVLDAKWTTAYQGSQAATPSGGYLRFTNANLSGDHVGYIYQTYPATPCTFLIKTSIADWFNAGLTTSGICVADGTGKIVAFTVGATGGGSGATVQYWTNPTTFSSTPYNNTNFNIFAKWHYMQISDDGTNLTFSTSETGIEFFPRFVVGRTAFLTAGPTRIGVLSYSQLTGVTFPVLYDWFRRTA